MRIVNNCKLFGEVTISVYDVKQGKFQRIFRHIQKNQITNDGRAVVLDMLGGGPLTWGGGTPYQIHPEWNWIWSFEVGTGNTPPTLADTTLGNYIWRSAFNLDIERPVYKDPQWALEISKTVPSGELTGSIITEAGIFTRGNNDDPVLAAQRRMYSRIVHTPVTKSITMALVYDWRLGITIEI